MTQSRVSKEAPPVIIFKSIVQVKAWLPSFLEFQNELRIIIDLSKCAFSELTELVQLLKSNAFPSSTSLDWQIKFSNENRGLPDEWKWGINIATIMADALKSGNTPENLTLDFDLCSINDEAALCLAKAIATRKTQAGLSLILTHNDISAHGAKALAKALPQSSSRFILRLNYNSICEAGARAFIQALKQCDQPGLLISIEHNCLNDNVLKEFETAYSDYLSNQHKSAQTFKCFVLQQGKQQGAKDISLLPQDILNLIYSYLSPFSGAVYPFMKARYLQLFINKYQSGLLHWRSEESQHFVSSISAILQKKPSEQNNIELDAVIKRFLMQQLEKLNANEYKKSRAIRLLKDYHLIGNQVIENPKDQDCFTLNPVFFK